MTTRGDARRDEVLATGVQLASVEGLEQLSIGRLAAAVGMSKSGLVGLFGTKQELQLAVVAAAREVFADRVLGRQSADHGVDRLVEFMHAWIDYLASFQGGCFFDAASAEFDDRPGPVRDSIVEVAVAARDQLREQIRLAKRLGEIADDVDETQLMFELHAYVLEANLQRQLFAETRAYDRAKRAISDCVDRMRAGVPVRRPAHRNPSR